MSGARGSTRQTRPTRSTGPSTRRRLLPRPTAADGGVVALLGLLCAVIVLGSAGASGWLRVTSDDMAAQVFGDAPVPARQLQVFYSETRNAQVPPEAGARVEESLAPSLRQLLQSPRHAVVTREAVMEALPKQPAYSPSYISTVGLPDLSSLVDVVEGELPEPGHRWVTLPLNLAETYDGPRRVPVVEVVISREAAEAMDVPVGAFVDLVPSRYSPNPPEVPALLQVSGTYEPATPERSPLDDVDNARRPAISTLPEFTLVRAAGLAADEQTVLEAPWAADPELRFTFEAKQLPTAAEAEAVVDDARRLAVQPWPPVVESAASASVTGLGELADSFLAEREASNTLVALLLASLAAAAFALLLAAAAVLEARRREVTDVLRARGAGSARLGVTRAGEGTLVVLPGLLAAAALVPVTPLAVRDLAPALVAAAVCVLLLTLAQVAPWRRLPERLRLPARDALQIVAVVLALGLGVVLWQREQLDATDPLLLALPVLLGIASAVLVVRAVQLLTVVVRGPAGRGRSLVPLVGASQAAATSRHVMLPVVALVLAIGSGLLASAVDDTVRSGAERAGWAEVGADARISQAELDETARRRIAAVDGVEAVAAVHTPLGLLDTPGGSKQVTVLGVDPRALAEVTGRGPDPITPPRPVGGEAGAVVASSLRLDPEGARLRYAQAEMQLAVVEEADLLPGLTTGEPFVLVDAEELRRASDRRLLRAQVMLVAGSMDPDRLRRTVEEVWPTARVHTRAEVAEALLEQPVAARTLLLARVTTIVSVVLAGLAAGLAVALGRPLRRRTTTVLQALGGDARQARRVAWTEVVPSMVAAGLAACGAALLLLTLTGSGVDVAAVTGGAGGSALALDAASWLVAAALLVGVVVLAAAVAGRQAGRSDDVRTPHEGGTG